VLKSQERFEDISEQEWRRTFVGGVLSGRDQVQPFLGPPTVSRIAVLFLGSPAGNSSQEHGAADLVNLLRPDFNKGTRWKRRRTGNGTHWPIVGSFVRQWVTIVGLTFASRLSYARPLILAPLASIHPLAATCTAVCHYLFWLENLQQNVMPKRKRGTEKAGGMCFKNVRLFDWPFQHILLKNRAPTLPYKGVRVC
jgi:hypothetical protein